MATRAEIKKRILDIVQPTRVEIGADGASLDSANASVFSKYCDSKIVGDKILAGLFAKRKADAKGVLHFVLDDVEERIGFLSDVYGCVGVLSLVNRMNVVLTEEQKAEMTDTVLSAFRHIETKGYTLDPYYNDKKANGEGIVLFGKKHYFVGSMTWSLSFLVSVRRAIKNGDLQLDSDAQKFIVDQIIAIIKRFSSNNYAILANAANGEERCVGWSISDNCKTPSLFYTYSVLEAYSDFEDAVFLAEYLDEDGEKVTGDEELQAKIKENTHIEYGDIFVAWRTYCLQAARNVWDRAKGYIQDEFIGDNFFDKDKVPTIAKNDIEKNATSNVLFNTLFVVFTGIYGYVNKKTVPTDGDVYEQIPAMASIEDDENVIKIMKEALQNVQATYEKLESRGKSYIVNTYNLQFQMEDRDGDHDREQLYSSRLNSENIFDASLVPMLVKSNSMLAFNIQRYPQQQMGRLFLSLFDTMVSDEDWVWDVNKYNVKNTERYLEAVADFYDYYAEYEESYVDTETAMEKKIAQRADQVGKRIANKKTKEAVEGLKKKHTAEMEEVRASYAFENLFREQVGQLAAVKVEEMLTAALGNIITAHEENKQDDLPAFEQTLDALFKRLVLSYLCKYIYDYSGDVVTGECLDKAAGDMDAFMAAYIKRLIESGDKQVLKDAIFYDKA